MNKIPLNDLLGQYLIIKREIDASIERVIKTSAFINGEDNKLFEDEYAKYLGIKHVIGVGSGSVALDLAIEALEIEKGDEILCPSHTFIATAEAISHRQATPVFIEIDKETYNIDPNKIEEKITKKTKAIIVVHLYGNPASMSKIGNIAKRYKLRIIEDAAQAHGAIYRNMKVGNFSDIAIFSFFPGKNLGCFGDGGAIVTNSTQIANKIRLLRDHGRIEKYKHKILGYGARLDNLQAAILRVKLRHLDDWNKRRREIANIYNLNLANELIRPMETENGKAVYYVYTLRNRNRKKLMNALKNKGVATGIYYPIPLHLQPAYKFLGYKKGDLPITEKICQEIFSIPIYPELTDIQIKYVVNALNRYLV